MGSLIFLLVLAHARAFQFLSPPYLAKFGEIYSVQAQQGISFLNTAAYQGTNFTVMIPPDYVGCKAVPVTRPNTCLWYVQPAPCSSLQSGYALTKIARQWQDSGAAAQIVAVTTLRADDVGSLYFSGGRWSFLTTPYEFFRYLGGSDADAAPSNPLLSTLSFLFLPGYQNITMQFSAPRTSSFLQENEDLGSPLSGIRWTTYTMTLIVCLGATWKISSFFMLEGFRLRSVPQICLGFVLFANLFLHIYYTLGMTGLNLNYIYLEPNQAIAYYWEVGILCAVASYSFYLVDVTSLGVRGNFQADRFLLVSIPCCAALAIIVIVTDAVVAAFPQGVFFDQVYTAQRATMAICFGLAGLLLIFAWLLLVLALRPGKVGLLVRLSVCNLFLLLGLCLGLAGKIMTSIGSSPGGYSYSRSNTYIAQAFGSFDTWIIGLTFLAAFRVQVSKEIELSKSATSGTSSSSSSSISPSSSSTSSSSSNNDPVIEL